MMEAGLISTLIESFVSFGPMGLLFLFMFFQSMSQQSENIERLEEKHAQTVDLIQEDKERYYTLLQSQSSLMSELKEIAGRQSQQLGEISDNQKEFTREQAMHANKLEKIESRIEWMDKHRS